ncbi:MULTISPECIES: hypothetical protein [unclassified Methylophaga]|jgi:hypothetical protein|uniref:hypothetical protein n=2 Tax=Methylophaga TaxID=40222 RepID=UPI00259D0C5B|nr:MULTISPECIES: hypothetical protein [unclassified Methylophaga]|tara:strand:+ start:6162 stop:6980 length:819 start_codon:yes stop_codon:yes gene_type:complete
MEEGETKQTGQGDVNKSESKREKLRKVSQEPFIGDQPTDLLHTRRNLLLISSIVIFSYFTGLEINPERLKYYFADDANAVFHINLAALFIISYLWVSFSWKYTDFYDTQLILTTKGIKFINKVSVPIGTDVEVPDLNENYSIYPWWKQMEQIVKYNNEVFITAASEVSKFSKSLAEEQLKKVNESSSTLGSRLDDLKYKVGTVQDSLRRITEHNPYQERVDKAMEHFGRHFWQCIHSQKIRVSILEGWLPLLLGALALSILINQVFTEIGWL